MDLIDGLINAGRKVVEPIERELDSIHRRKNTTYFLPNMSLKYIEKFLEFDEKNKMMRACYDKWMKNVYLKDEFYLWEGILSVYYKTDGLASTLARLRDYIKDENNLQNDMDRFMYKINDNYLFYIKHYVDEIKNKYKKVEAENNNAKHNNGEGDIDTHLLFIKSECMDIEQFRMIYNLMSEKRVTSLETTELKNKIKKVAESLKGFVESEMFNIEIEQKVLNPIRENNEILNKKIKRYEGLYNEIISIFTEEWLKDLESADDKSYIKEEINEVCKRLNDAQNSPE